MEGEVDFPTPGQISFEALK